MELTGIEEVSLFVQLNVHKRDIRASPTILLLDFTFRIWIVETKKKEK